YFKAEKVRVGIFALAGKLWGLTFTERPDIDVYHPDVKAFEVKEADGTHIGIFYTDYYVRPSKRGGAWMTSYRKQQRIKGKNITPIIINVCNFPAPTDDMPSLLTFEQVTTAFHEFGHAMHGLLSDCEFNTLSGTSVARDFVELPSQLMENWASEPEVLKMYAKHYKTGEVMPQELVDKIVKASKFNQGFATTEYVAASLLDMDWHTQTAPVTDVNAFEKAAMAKYGMISEIVPRYRSTYFAHIFSGGYSSGYYSYMWAEVLDADAFNAFKENGIFDKATAKSLRDNIYSQGGTEDPMKLYINFRGAEPNTSPLLERKGLK
nr:M3 family metallopeptidase [Bacteroidales bacterium]